MDAQLRRGVLDVLVLSTLQSEDSYGYKIIKDVKPVLDLSESTLYTILKRLIEEGMVESRSTEFEGRLRKYYHITSKGMKRLMNFNEEWKELMAVYSFINKEGRR